MSNFENLSYKALQALAKEAGIKANGKKIDLITSLRELDAQNGTPYYHSLWSTKVMWEHPQRAWLRGVATAAREGAALLAHTGYT